VGKGEKKMAGKEKVVEPEFQTKHCGNCKIQEWCKADAGENGNPDCTDWQQKLSDRILGKKVLRAFKAGDIVVPDSNKALGLLMKTSLKGKPGKIVSFTDHPKVYHSVAVDIEGTVWYFSETEISLVGY
jgi:hypothetical protein